MHDAVQLKLRLVCRLLLTFVKNERKKAKESAVCSIVSLWKIAKVVAALKFSTAKAWEEAVSNKHFD